MVPLADHGCPASFPNGQSSLCDLSKWTTKTELPNQPAPVRKRAGDSGSAPICASTALPEHSAAGSEHREGMGPRSRGWWRESDGRWHARKSAPGARQLARRRAQAGSGGRSRVIPEG